MIIDETTARHIARLCSLEFGRSLDPHGLWAEPTESLMRPAELELMAKELDAILLHVKKLETLSLDDVPATSHGVALCTVMRPDEPAHTLPTSVALSQAKSSIDGHFAVPKVVE